MVQTLSCLKDQASHSLQAIIYKRDSLQIIDQLQLPDKFVYIDIKDTTDAFKAIKSMSVRGAPAIAVTGVLSLAVELLDDKNYFQETQQVYELIKNKLEYLVSSRPTAVNMREAKHRCLDVLYLEKDNLTEPNDVIERYIKEAQSILHEDLEQNKAISINGSRLLQQIKQNGSSGQKLNVLTHCNTGSLATSGFGTALGVIRQLFEDDKIEHVYCTETRPYNQGARLTAFELTQENIPSTLVCDSTVALLLVQKKVDAIVVGADRITLNGDTANKIGTLQIASLAKFYGVPFYVAAPINSFDQKAQSGDSIKIEERPGDEISHFKGQQVVVKGMHIYNPAFDVTPHHLITAIITEKGVIENQDALKGFNVSSFLNHVSTSSASQRPQQPDPQKQQEKFDKALSSDDDVINYVLGRKVLQERVGDRDSVKNWKVKEIGDGNINYIFVVEGPRGAICLKQALEYIRIMHSWTLAQERNRIEADALILQHKLCPQHVPEVFLYDYQYFIIAMQYLAPPHRILRHQMVEGKIFPKVGIHLATFMARTLFFTSQICLKGKQFREQVHKFSNPDMCELTEQVIFTDPYYPAPVNRHTSPQLDDIVHQIQHDFELKHKITLLKEKFCQKQQALVHGDMHTGSVMNTLETTYLIDAEFATYGPIAFDVGKLLGNYIISYLSADGHASKENDYRSFREWVLSLLSQSWNEFKRQFTKLWDENWKNGDLYSYNIFQSEVESNPQNIKKLQKQFMDDLWIECMGMGGAVIIRRIVGIAHNIDMEKIEDQNKRAACERRALDFGRRMVLQPEIFQNVEILVEQIKMQRNDAQQPYFD